MLFVLNEIVRHFQCLQLNTPTERMFSDADRVSFNLQLLCAAIVDETLHCTVKRNEVKVLRRTSRDSQTQSGRHSDRMRLRRRFVITDTARDN